MKHLRVADLLANSPIDPEAHLDAARVERYTRMLDTPEAQDEEQTGKQ